MGIRATAASPPSPTSRPYDSVRPRARAERRDPILAGAERESVLAGLAGEPAIQRIQPRARRRASSVLRQPRGEAARSSRHPWPLDHLLTAGPRCARAPRDGEADAARRNGARPLTCVRWRGAPDAACPYGVGVAWESRSLAPPHRRRLRARPRRCFGRGFGSVASGAHARGGGEVTASHAAFDRTNTHWPDSARALPGRQPGFSRWQADCGFSQMTRDAAPTWAMSHNSSSSRTRQSARSWSARGERARARRTDGDRRSCWRDSTGARHGPGSIPAPTRRCAARGRANRAAGRGGRARVGA